MEPTKSLFVNMDAAMLKLAVGEPSATKQVTLLNVPYEAWEYPYFIAYIKDGDKIAINIPNYSLKLLVSDEEMEERKKTMKIREPKKLTGYLKRYAKNVSSADKGAIVE